jgi:uncharacterized protein (DUF697 family)
MFKAATMNAADLLSMVRKGVNVHAVHSEARKPFRFLLCGDPELVSQLRSLLLFSARPDANVPLDAAATLETIDPTRGSTITVQDARAIIFLGRPGDLAGARIDLLQPAKLPLFAVTVDPTVNVSAGPVAAPLPGTVGEYVVPDITREALRGRFFAHLIDRCRSIEVAVGRRLPALRETVAAKLTRDAASSALKMAAASAIVDNVPVLGIFLGAVVSAGDMVAITGVQIVLMLQIGATYGKDPDVQRIWELLPVVGGGLGWRALSRELAGFVPVAGVAIKGAIAYAGTIVVGEGVGFYYEHGRHMTPAQAGSLYEDTKRIAMGFARDIFSRFRKTDS